MTFSVNALYGRDTLIVTQKLETKQKSPHRHKTIGNDTARF